ncbi:hypothetical protein [Ekhidna sp.]|uniref:hypothetical protein n=1 Tax=Ekhidna sp. TaxID=2608089 RepID=UPI003514C32E
MIKHIDFTPKVTKKGGLFKSTEIETFTDIVTSMNEWTTDSGHEIINIETVLLPNIHDSDEEGSEDTMLGTGRESSSHWYQLIRVWYKE